MTTTFLAPDPAQSTFFVPGTNTPGNGVLLFTYLAGTNTKQTTYKDNVAGSSWTNPIVLDSGGNLPSGGSVWLTQGLSYKLVWAPANDTDPPASPYRTIDNVSGINDITLTSTGEWVSGSTPTFIGASSLSIVGDQTATYHVGRRLKFTVTAGTVYGTIRASSFGAGITTITMAMDSTSLDSGLGTLFYALLDSVNPSVPIPRTNIWRLADSTDPLKNISFNLSEIAASTTINFTTNATGIENVYGPNVSSGAVMSLASSAGYTIQDFGTTNVTSIALQAGRTREVVFQSTRVLSSSATLLMGALGNVTTQAGDVMTVVGETIQGSSGARVVGYHFGGPSGVRGASQVLLLSSTASSTLTMDLPLSSAFDDYLIMLDSIVPTDASSFLRMRMGTASGTTTSYDAGAAAYSWALNASDATSASSTHGLVSDASVLMNASSAAMTNAASTGGWNGQMWLHRVNDTTHQKHANFNGSYNGNTFVSVVGSGVARSTTTTANPVNGARFFFSAGSVSTGTFLLYGLRGS
jgi:hypothetical protein